MLLNYFFIFFSFINTLKYMQEDFLTGIINLTSEYVELYWARFGKKSNGFFECFYI